uniref:uncharacterized protein LOC122609295 n=1 Tax=Erigeron canadensis TaxID=72917 RepID=UPI001CB920D8|nr:uncharacterized protein LOC122609295 [Erigeron canadensis]
MQFVDVFWSALKYVAPAIKSIHDIKVNHGRSNLLVKRICEIVIDQVDHDMAWNILGSAMAIALTYGIRELIEECILKYPGLIWYIIDWEVEKFVKPSHKEDQNGNRKTPRQVFTESHKDLLEKGQQSMKDTASSCTVVAALVVTMAFAAAFTMPGGNQDDGKPLFLNDGTFMLFFVSDAVALFSSVTSVLMFLGILTSRYAEEDFLYALPKRLTIGLLSLFMSLAATMIAFSAVLALMLRDKVTWIAAPLVIATGIPVCLFGLLQFPLLMELVNSTYGRSIFRPENGPMIH